MRGQLLQQDKGDPLEQAPPACHTGAQRGEYLVALWSSFEATLCPA